MGSVTVLIKEDIKALERMPLKGQWEKLFQLLSQKSCITEYHQVMRELKKQTSRIMKRNWNQTENCTLREEENTVGK